MSTQVTVPGARVTRLKRRKSPWSVRTWFLRSNALAHTAVVAALSEPLGLPLAALVGAALCALTLLRVSRADLPVRRPRWVSLALDEPVFAHFGAALLAFPLWVAGTIGVFVARLFGVAQPLRLAGFELSDIGSLAALAYLVGASVSLWALWGRRRWIREPCVEVALARLPAPFDGYRIVQLSDLHIGNFDTRARGLDWARRASRHEPDAIVVTGDLVTTGTLFYEDVADVIGALRAKDGVFVSLGNHDQADPSRLVRALRERGVRVLLNESHAIERDGARLVVAGLDDAFTGKDDLERTLEGLEDETVVLLSHYPRFVTAAAKHNVALVLSGHTHAGQVGVPFMADRFSVSSLFERYIHGLFRVEDTLLYVNAGLGTTGAPLRLGSSPEITTFVLRRATDDTPSRAARRAPASASV